MKNKIKHFGNLLKSNTARNTYAIFGGNILSAFFSFLFTVLLVRNVTLSDFGYFSALLSFLLLTSDLADLGIGSSLSSFLPALEKNKKSLLSFMHTAFNFQSVIALIITVFILLVADSLSRILFHSSEFTFLIKVTALGIFLTIAGNFVLNTLSALQKFYQTALIGALAGLFRLVFLLTLLFLSAINLDNAVIMQTFAQALLVVCAFLFLGLDFLKVKTVSGNFKKLFRFAVYLGIARGLTAIASRLDILMLVALKNATEAGIYSTAAKVISIYPLLAGSFSSVLAPRVAKIGSRMELSVFLKKTILATVFLIATAVVMMVIARPFITILFGQKAAPAVEVFRWLLLSMVFFVGSIPSVTLSIYYLKKPQILTINSILQLVIVFVGNLYFIPRFGHIGASFSMILAYGITLILTSFMAFYYYKKKHE